MDVISQATVVSVLEMLPLRDIVLKFLTWFVLGATLHSLVAIQLGMWSLERKARQSKTSRPAVMASFSLWPCVASEEPIAVEHFSAQCSLFVVWLAISLLAQVTPEAREGRRVLRVLSWKVRRFCRQLWRARK